MSLIETIALLTHHQEASGGHYLAYSWLVLVYSQNIGLLDKPRLLHSTGMDCFLQESQNPVSNPKV